MVADGFCSDGCGQTLRSWPLGAGSVPPRCFCDSLRCGAYGTFCYGISSTVVIIGAGSENGRDVSADSGDQAWVLKCYG